LDQLVSQISTTPVSAPSSADGKAADGIRVLLRPSSLLRGPGALIVTTLAVSDVAYRLLLREPVRRMLGIRH
jgi:hypothetical protein